MSSFIRVRDKKTGKIVEIPIAKVGKSAYEIPVTYGKKLKVVGVKLNDASSIDKFRWICFDSSGDTLYDSYLTPASGSGAGITCWDSENNIFDTSQLNSMYKNLAYIRFCCYPAGSNENIIVTEVA